MAKGPSTYYDTLGVAPTAEARDISRAYKRLKAQLESDSAAPDPKRLKRVEEAFVVLGNRALRDAYDVTLVQSRRMRTGVKAFAMVASVVVGVAGIVSTYVATRPAPSQAVHGASQEEILNAASIAVGRLQSLDVNGQATELGVAFAIAEGVMVAPCRGIAPSVQLVVSIPPRTIPARVASTDETLGLCKLSAHGTGTRPLPLSGAEPKPGDRLYAANVGGTGKVALSDGYVRKVQPEARLIDASLRESAVASGSPLIDVYGRVVGLAFVAAADGKTRHVELPKAWIREINEPGEPGPKTQATVEESAPAAAAPKPAGPASAISPERRKKLEETYRPPPKLPDGL
jgi:hypothetical protein